MKLISLNTWGAKAGLDNMLHFFKQHSDTDIFCLQEIWNGGEHVSDRPQAQEFVGLPHLKGFEPRLLGKLEQTVSGFQSYFRPQFYDFFGLALFIKKEHVVIEEGERFVYKERGYITPGSVANHARCMQYITIETEQGLRTIIHFHGLWNGGDKFDSDDRLVQSDKIITFIKDLKNPYILCGDFNLLPETESIKKFETAGMRNLIKEYAITSTRTRLYTKEQRFADYVFVSNGIDVVDFQVLPDEVSDHNALCLKFT